MKLKITKKKRSIFGKDISKCWSKCLKKQIKNQCSFICFLYSKDLFCGTFERTTNAWDLTVSDRLYGEGTLDNIGTNISFNYGSFTDVQGP